MSAPAIDFFGVLSESKRIVSAHSRHFLALSVLFLLPLSFFLIAAPTFRNSIQSDTNWTESLLQYSSPSDTNRFKTVSLCLLYAGATLALSLSATSTVTYSVINGFFGRPVKFVSAVRSLSSSLWRLFLTAIWAISAIAVVSILAVSIVFLLTQSFSFFVLQLSPTAAHAIALIFLVFGAIYLQANWAPAPVIVVAESSWGLEPLRRSVFLVRGARRVEVSLGLFFAVGVGSMLWLSSLGTAGTGFGSMRGLQIAQTALSSAVMTTLLLYALVANTVMYMYCKALHGELVGEIVAEFAREYVSLPFDEQKMPHLVSVA